MQIDFSGVDDVESYVSIPAGKYLCKIAEVRPGVTRDGSPRWALRLEVAGGEYAGRTAAWDGLSWSERALPRVKIVLQLLGFDVSGHLDLSPDDLLGKRLLATLVEEEHEHSVTGARIKALCVPYRGYEAPGDETPF